MRDCRFVDASGKKHGRKTEREQSKPMWVSVQTVPGERQLVNGTDHHWKHANEEAREISKMQRAGMQAHHSCLSGSLAEMIRQQKADIKQRGLTLALWYRILANGRLRPEERFDHSTCRQAPAGNATSHGCIFYTGHMF